MKLVVPSSDSVTPLINAGRNLSCLLNDKAKKLIEQSNAHLSPFQDPLSLDFASNRWFAGGHEENYSDWLAWIIEQLNDPKLVFRLLKIDDASFAEECIGKKLIINRESYVEKGHEGQSGSLDVKIQYESKVLIVVEVKLTDAESADIKKNDGYYESVEKITSEKRYYKLLVTDAKNKEYNTNNSFKVLIWKDVCMELRRMAADSSVKEPLVGALMLAFAGAVEQHLLGIPSVKSKRVHSELIDYLQDILPGGRTMEKNDETARLQLVKDGLPTYLDAQWAIHEFQKEIIRLTKETVNKRLKDLGTAMKISLSDKNISDDVYYNDDSARLGCTIGGFESGLNLLYFSLYFEPNLCVAVSMVTQYASQRESLLNHCKTVYKEFDNPEGNEICLADYSIGVENFSEFKEKLNGLIDKWIEVWEKVEVQFREQFR